MGFACSHWVSARLNAPSINSSSSAYGARRSFIYRLTILRTTAYTYIYDATSDSRQSRVRANSSWQKRHRSEKCPHGLIINASLELSQPLTYLYLCLGQSHELYAAWSWIRLVKLERSRANERLLSERHERDLSSPLRNQCSRVFGGRSWERQDK